MSDCSANNQTRKYKRVTISESPRTQLYHLDPSYERFKSYSKDDCKRFHRDSMIKAVRIKKFVLSLTSSGASAEESFKYFNMNHDLLEEV